MSAQAGARGVPGTEQSRPYQGGIHSRSPSRGRCHQARRRKQSQVGSEEPALTPPEGCGTKFLTLTAARVFPLRLGPPSGAAKVHRLDHEGGLWGERTAGQLKPVATKEFEAANQHAVHSYCLRSNEGREVQGNLAPRRACPWQCAQPGGRGEPSPGRTRGSTFPLRAAHSDHEEGDCDPNTPNLFFPTG